MNDSGIYEIVSLVNGKRYVGSAVNIGARWRGHRHDLNGGRHHSRHLQRSWAKHGESAFEFRVLALCPRDQLIALEQEHIDRLAPEYNSARVAGSSLGVKRTEASRAKQSAARLGMKLSEEHRAAIGDALRGKARSLSAIEKTRKSRTGLRLGPMADSHKKAIADAHSGRRLSQEHCEAISRAKSGKKRPDMTGNRFASFKRSADFCRRMSEARKGIPKSPETVARMKAAWVLRKAARLQSGGVHDASRI